MNEQPASELAGNFARHRFAEELAETYHPDGYVCQNCTQVVSRVTLVPEFEYMGCDDCMAEALAQIEREAAQAAMLAEIGCTPAEVDAVFPRKTVTRQQGELNFGEVA
jgi:hypothetical protein